MKTNHFLCGLTLLSALLTGCASTPANTTQTSKTENICKIASAPEIEKLFDRWNQSLQTGDTKKVVANYAENSILLPTVSNKPRISKEEKADYFEHFLTNKPVGKIDSRIIKTACNTAIDAGLYTFTFGSNGMQVKARYTYTYEWNGTQWLITSHHSSKMPEPI